MVGLCGIIGGEATGLKDIIDGMQWRGDEHVRTYDGEGFSIGSVEHSEIASTQPVRIDADRLLWVWGVILGHERRGTYREKPPDVPGPAFVAHIIDQFGLPAVAGLNSEFVGIVLDEAERTVSFFTDRLGSRPLYYTHTTTGSLAFSPLIQALGGHRDISLSFDPSFLSEFLHYHRSLGVHTPVAGIKQIPPASVVTISFDGQIRDTWTYWWPKPVPKPWSYEQAVEELSEALTVAVNDRIEPGHTGLFLSGGADSRAILAAANSDVTAFHFNEQLRKNREAVLAKRAADRTGVEFEFLERDLDHYPHVLAATETLTNYNGYFRVANHLGFEDQITERTTHVLNGQYSDTLIGPTYVPMVDGAPQPIQHAEDYISAFEAGEMGGHTAALPFVTQLPDPAGVLRETPSGIANHGVTYPSWEALVEFGMIYPITNVRSFIWYETQVQCFSTQYPFFDNRVIDTVLALPREFRYQRQIMADVLQHLDPGLAGLERRRDHPLLYYVRGTTSSQLFDDLARGVGIRDGPVTFTQSNSHLRPASGFPHTAGLIRSHPFIDDLIEERSTDIEACPYFDRDALMACLEAHSAGDNYTDRLFGVASLVQSAAFRETGWDSS